MEFRVLGPSLEPDRGVQAQVIPRALPVRNAVEAGSGSASSPGALEKRMPVPDARKTVTILFTDIVNSSRLNLALDPEALRNLLARYFGELSAVVRRHGGIVEKYIGDAIMALYGEPTKEDDPLRAVRTAVEMRA